MQILAVNQRNLKIMKMTHFNFHLIVLSVITRPNVAQGTRNATKVVSLAFMDSNLLSMINRETLKDLHTFAELKFDPRASLPDSFTICSTIMTLSSPNIIWPNFFTLLDNNMSQLLAPIFHGRSIHTLTKIYYLQKASKPVMGKVPLRFPNEWTKSCIAIDTTIGLVRWVVDGTIVMNSISEAVKRPKSKPRDLGKRLLLGSRSIDGVWFASSHKVTNVNIFSSPLSFVKMKSMTEGSYCAEEGDYLAWGDMEWTLHGKASLEIVDHEEPCKQQPYVNLYYTSYPSMEACMHHCEKLGTRFPPVTSFQDWAKLRNNLKRDLFDKGLNNFRLWLAVRDNDKEGEWRDFYTGTMIQNYTPPWLGSQPDGGETQNCVYLMNGDTWDDYHCDSPNLACMCAHNRNNVLQLKGKLPNSFIDRYYKPISNFKDVRKLTLQGMEQNIISYDDDKWIWTLDMSGLNISITTKAPHSSFTLGKHQWKITGDKGYDEGESYVTQLKLSGCAEGNFTCNDGQCITMDQRCNQLLDCRDESDERDCQILVLKDGYNMNVPPIDNRYPVNVSVSIDLLKLVDINEEDYSIEIQIEITLVWKEKRATYHNLKERDSLNSLSKKDIDSLWLPKVIYENTDQKETTRVGSNWEWETRVVVRREQKMGTMSGPESVDEVEIFRGNENSLVMNQTYTHNFQCNYKLSYYPFDTQV